MISLELFKKIIKDIQEQELKDEQLTKLLVCPECTGWVSTCEPIMDDLIKLLQFELKDKYETLEWYLYDVSDGHKFVYENKNEEEQIKYNLNDLDSLYYYIIGNYSEVPQETIKRDDKDTILNEDNYADFCQVLGEYL